METKTQKTNASAKLACLRSRMAAGRAKMAGAKVVLKDHFVGIDSIIDEVFDNMEAWYLLPETVTRPVIINLWGMTGVGKTDLVRKIVSLLDFGDAYFEMQLSHTDNEHVGKSIATALSRSNIEQGKPGILLLDEFQRFRAVDERGAEMQNLKFQDIWILLSDGKFASSARKNEILEMVLDNVYRTEEYGEERRRKKKKERKFHTSFYSAQSLKNTLHLREPIEEIMSWDTSKRMEIAAKRLNNKDAFAQEDYSKLLIFNSGNLDDAYSMADEVANGDIDADIFHDQSKTINIVDIKNALSRRFKPEHISRLGNTHIIYPSLSKNSYRQIIQKNTDKFLKSISDEHGFHTRLDQSVYDFIYRNGVFPTQGVRPVFTTISSFVENSIPKIMMNAIDLGETFMLAKYHDGNLHVVSDDAANMGQKVIDIPWVGAMDRIRDSRNDDLKTVVSVHEAGHAILYAILFGHIPRQILSSAAGFGGVTCVNANTFLSKATILDKMCVSYAGIAAEELIFGKDMLTSGCSRDIETATDIAVKALKEGGMFGISSLVKSAALAARTGERANIDDNETVNRKVEQICTEQRKRAKAILAERQELLCRVSAVMIQDGQIKPSELQTILKENNIDADLIGTSEMVIADYHGTFDKYAKKAKPNSKKIKFKPAGIRMKRGTNVTDNSLADADEEE